MRPIELVIDGLLFAFWMIVLATILYFMA